ncbi:MAG: helicase C-terminal domain-containing protein [Ktedonobacteraceae bacterium]
MADSKLDALRKYGQSMGWNFGPSTLIQYGEQITITSGPHKAKVNYYPKNGRLVSGGPSSPLKDALQVWIKSANQTGESTQTSGQQVLTSVTQPINVPHETEQSSGETLQIPSVIMRGPHIGMDESGKGDWFGPLVIAAVFVDEQTSVLLREIGVRDSKLLTASAIQHLAARIEDIIPTSHRHILILEPRSYNELYDKHKNINLLLADAYARVALEIWKRTHATVIVCDQFSQNTDRLDNAFAAEHLPKPIQQHHAESFSIAVAAASILASAAFVEALAQLGTSAGMNSPLPKGASEIAKLEAAAQQVIKRYGTDTLGQYAKLNFKPIQTLLGGAAKPPVGMPPSQAGMGRPVVVPKREWRMQYHPGGFWRFLFNDGGILEWYADSTGKLDVRGKPDSHSYQTLQEIAHGRIFNPGTTAEETQRKLERLKARVEELFPLTQVDIPVVPGIGWERKDTVLGIRFDFTDGGNLQYYHSTDRLLIQGTPSEPTRTALEKLSNPFWLGLDTLTDYLRALFPDWRLGQKAIRADESGWLETPISRQPLSAEEGVDWRPFWPTNREMRQAANGKGPCQRALVEDWSFVLAGHSGKRHLLAHAPTGLGKTLSALVPALAWVAMAPDHRRIYYFVNRVNQHDNPIRELKAALVANFTAVTGQRLHVVDMVGRHLLCRYPQLDNLTNFCKRSRDAASFDQLPAHVFAWQEVQAHLSNRACPYHTLQGLMAHAHLVICDYWWLFSEAAQDRGMTERAGFSARDSIIIVDEAHNLPMRVRAELSIDEPIDDIDRAILRAPELVRSHLETIMEEVSLLLPGEGTSPSLLTRRVGGRRAVQAALDILRAFEPAEGQASIPERLLCLLLQPDEAVVAYLEAGSESTTRLIFRLVDPTPTLSSGYYRVNASLSMSGTLAAPSDDSDELSYQVPLFGLPLSETLTRKYASPFPQNNRRWVYCPDTLGTFKEREKYLDTYADHIVAIGQSTPGVTAVFFSSYSFLRQVRERVIGRVEQEIVVSEVQADAEGPDTGLMNVSDYEQRLRDLVGTNGRAFLFAVYQGKLAEGADFDRNLIKTVICISIPLEYPRLYHERLQLLYESFFRPITEERGDDLREKAREYALDRVSLSQVLQACGRGIRREIDRCAFVLLDKRYGDKDYRWRRYLEPRPYNLTHPEQTVATFHDNPQAFYGAWWDSALLPASTRGDV